MIDEKTMESRFKKRNIIPLDGKRFVCPECDDQVAIANIIETLKFYYHYRKLHDFSNIAGKSYRVLDLSQLSIPGQISDLIGALYRSALSKKLVLKILETKPAAVLLIYTNFEPALSYEEANPAGLVQLLFDVYLLAEM